jgi:hypothetical protein
MIDHLTMRWAWISTRLLKGRWSSVVRPIDGAFKTFGIKLALAHLEVHLVDHCNLNCRGCDHFSPIADKWFADLKTYEQDLRQLKKLFSGIHTLFLLGGEPLLHPEVERFLFATRSYFPNIRRLVLMTNGILLDKMPASFWESCKKTSTELIFDVYPPLYSKEQYLLDLATSNRVKISSSKVQDFQACLNLKGDSNIGNSFKKCSFRRIHQLKEGKIYVCIRPMVAGYFNKRYGTQLPSDGWIDIYTPNLTGWDIQKEFDTVGFSTCSYCSTSKEQLLDSSFKWSTSSLKMTEWDAATYRRNVR